MRNVIILALLWCGCLPWQQAEGVISEGKQARTRAGPLVAAFNYKRIEGTPSWQARPLHCCETVDITAKRDAQALGPADAFHATRVDVGLATAIETRQYISICYS